MLTDTKLRALRPRDRLYRVADANGLCIEVTPAGGKHWRYRYRFNGRASMLGLGEYPHVSLVEARRLRDEARTTLAAGASPALAARARREAQAERAENTFGAVALEWIDSHGASLAPATLKRERSMLDRFLMSSLGAIPVADVKTSDVLAALRRIQAQGRLESAHRVRALAGRIMRYAVATGRAERNPVADLAGALPTPETTHFAAPTEPVAVGELLRAIEGYSGYAVVTAALKLAPLVFVRPGELRTMRWADVDLDAAEWRYTATKTGTPHIVPLSTQAVTILTDLRALTGTSEFAFPSVRSWRRPISDNTLNAALRRLGYTTEQMTAHGWRAVARTMLDERLGFAPHLIEHQLAHAVRDPLGRAYNRTSHLPERRKMMQAWADYLDTLRTGANVVPIKRRASGSSR
ncbi:MAG: integrase arm-type DNA-binding domain-containing protein [Xanthomonadales bacterium]|nr:integrase arm-type DNA-binding domain-containing protein [Xanthomonadales bacterium]